ncbi:Nif3-like dinuclear metal center hexameric protein [Desulforamulus ruminis]|uniref:Nif3-like dinuclear metal center hexameric protein n=1 Tax=Desulforamulus ruminis TaxID=1564 RepID=UPI0023555274|nr:Nif3-like dinuclear metal center hexameric protein [Desulforamulus ruminis]
MSVTGQEIVKVVEALAPRWLAEAWDNSGWQVGDPGARVDKVLLALDVDHTVAKEALEKKAQLIICHHPLLMKGIKSIRLDDPQGVLLADLIQNNIGVYAAHTNLDSAADGVNALLAERMGLTDLEVLQPAAGERYNKLVVFVPVEQVEAVSEAMARAGAGHIGNYSHCTFRTQGTGTFYPLAGARPFIGQPGQLAKVDEIRLETIVPVSKVSAVLQAMLSAHPYEEVAYDLYPLENRSGSLGLGRVGVLGEALGFADLVIKVKEVLGLTTARVGGGMWKEVRKIAVCGGSGAELWPVAAAKGAEVFITGDIKYHTAQDMLAAGLNFIDAGHFATEYMMIPELQNKLAEACRQRGWVVDFLTTKRQSDPFTYL